MRTFKKNVSFSSKELTERRAAQTIYCNLNKTKRTNRTHVVNPDSSVSSKSQKDKLRIIRGKEIFLQKFGDENTQKQIHNQVIENGNKLTKGGIQDYNISELNADINTTQGVDYPGDDISGNNLTDISENYIYNLDIHGDFDNQIDTNPAIEMTDDIYKTYQFFKNYPYTTNEEGNIDYSTVECSPYVNKKLEQANTNTIIYRKPKTLIGSKLTLEDGDQFCKQ